MALFHSFLWLSSIPFGEGSGTPLQYSRLENPMDGGSWWAAVHGVAKSRTRLSDFTFTFHFHALEKEMATHSSVLAWRVPGTGDPGGLLSMGSHRVGHDWSDLVAAATAAAALSSAFSFNFPTNIFPQLNKCSLWKAIHSIFSLSGKIHSTFYLVRVWFSKRQN